MPNRDLYVTGLPRGGTTLTCELLGSLPDCVALDEPMDLEAFLGHVSPKAVHSMFARVRRRPAVADAPDHARIVDNIVSFSADARQSIRQRGIAQSKVVNGQVLGTKVADAVGPDGTRIRLTGRGEIVVTKPLSESFTLVVKHNSAFAAVLAELARRAPVYAVVRNPLSVLASWQTVPFAVRWGHATLAEAFEPALARALAAIPDTMDRQLYLIGWFFERFLGVLPRSSIMRYEDIVASDGKLLALVEPSAAHLTRPLLSRNRAKVYEESAMRELAQRLLRGDGAYWDLYARDDVAELLPT